MKEKFLILIAFILVCQPVIAQPMDKLTLVVVIAVDQLRRDRLHDDFPGGLGRLIRHGKVFAAARTNHANTSTCPGHAVMLTGVNPAKAGIPGNRYIDRQSWESRYCVDDDDTANRVFGAESNRSPKNLLVTALGDWLKAANKNSRVFAVGGKDRSAIILGGHDADGVYWFDSSQGLFTSSRYYLDQLPGYIRDFNGSEPLQDGFLSRLPEYWEHAPGNLREDDFSGESDEFGRTSGHPIRRGALQEIADQVYHSPFVDTASLDLARLVVECESLGQRGSIDLLAVALSASDSIGHLYGPFSAESDDALKNVDLMLGKFLAFLDEAVGKGNYVVALSSDHGVAEIPEWSIENDRLQCPVASGRASQYILGAKMYWYLYRNFTFPFGNPASLVKNSAYSISVNSSYARERGIEPNDVIVGIKVLLEDQLYVKRAWTLKDVMGDDSEVARLYRNSYVEGKGGDLFLQLEPSCFLTRKGASHGTPYDFDRDIPLIFYGKAIPPGVSGEMAHSVDIATTLADFLGIPAPAHVDGRLLMLR